MKFIVICLALTAVLSGCVTRTVEKETVVEKRPSTSTVIVPQGSTTAPAGDTTIIVPAR